MSSTMKNDVGFFESMNPIGLFVDAKYLTPHEFLRDFYTQRGLHEKLKDVDALVLAYGHQMHLLYAELDKKYGTNFSSVPPQVREEIRSGEPVAAVVQTPVTPKAPAKPPVHKIILLGNSGVGKTNLLTRLHKDEFSEEFTSTIGVEFLAHSVRVDNADVKVQIWDTAGQERYHSMMSTYYRKAVGAVLIFDVSDRQSLLGVEKWLDQLLNVAEPGLHAVLVGNKCDLPSSVRAVTVEEAQQYATTHHMTYIETSAKTGQGVQEAFHSLITNIHRAHLSAMTSSPEFTTVDLASANAANSESSSSLFDCKFI